MNTDIFCGQLKMFSRFDHGRSVSFEYDMEDHKLGELKDKYNLTGLYSAKDSTVEKSIKIMNWITANVRHNGSQETVPYDALTILDYTFAKGGENGVHCLCLSAVLSECLLSVGIRARILHMLPLSPYDWDSHVVVMAYMPESRNWVFLDPTYNCYIMDESGDLLSPMQIRERLGDRKKLLFSPGAAYNGEKIDEEELTEYYAKDMFFFFTNLINTRGSEYLPNSGVYPKRQRNIYLSPFGFDPYVNRREKIKYILGETENNADFRELCSYWHENLKFLDKTKDRHILANKESFFGK